ncbi:MAG: hypothetical protein LBJ11_00280 [Oscillospiraceae bacterium]|jgi:hypothetical protein|nr:hypothetical protein [Oscillospiraceae bacterium]
MNRTRSLILVLSCALFLLLSVALFSVCRPAPPETLLLGCWQADDASAEYPILEFREDHSARLGLRSNDVAARYTLAPPLEAGGPPRLTVTYQLRTISASREYIVTVTRRELLLQPAEGAPLRYCRAET